MDISLRPLRDEDLDTLFLQAVDAESIRMAAFTPEDQTDRAAFDAKMARIRSDPTITHRAIVVDGRVAGTVASFVVEGEREVTYWIDRSQWGRGIASAALRLLLEEVPERPIVGRAASDNTGSLRVLEKAGFRRVGVDRGFAHGRGVEVEETILRLD